MPIWKQQLLARANRFMKPAGDDGSDNSGTGSGGDDGAGGEGGGDDGAGGEGGGEGEGEQKPPVKKPALSDNEAKLLKENMQKKEALAKANADLAAAAAKLKDFEGVDPAEIKKLIADKKTAEEAQLAAKGEWETLKARMATEHTTATKALQDQIAALQAQLAAANGQVDTLSVGTSFGQSAFLGETVYTPSKAKALWGSHFDLVDGKVVGYDKPRGEAGRTAYVDQFGNAVGFDDALRKIVEADPDKDSILKSKVKDGAGSQSRAREAQRKVPEQKDGLSKIGAGLAALNIHGQK